ARDAIMIAERPRAPWPHARDQRIERALAAVVAGSARARHDLERSKIRLLEQEVDDKSPEGLRLGGAAHASFHGVFVFVHARYTNGPLFGYTEIAGMKVRNLPCRKKWPQKGKTFSGRPSYGVVFNRRRASRRSIASSISRVISPLGDSPDASHI